MSIAIPNEIQNKANDYVTWSIQEGNTTIDRETQVCYSKDMKQLTTVGFYLRPCLDKSQLPNAHFLEWITLCKKNKLIPECAIGHVDADKNYLTLPVGCGDHSLIYAALCCYRWSDSFARMVWQIIEHTRAYPHLSFFQLLHYGLAQHYTYGAGHSFSPVYVSSYGPYGNNEKYDLAQLIAVKQFYMSYTPDQRNKSKDASYAVNTYIGNMASNLGGFNIEEVANGPYKTQKRSPILYISNLEDLLTDRWTRLYNVENPTKEVLKKLYDETKK